MSFVSPSVSSSRPPDSYVPPREILSPHRAPTKLHQIVDVSDNPRSDITIQTRMDIVIARKFDAGKLDMYQNMLTCPQSIMGWMTICDEIAHEFLGKSFFGVQAYEVPQPQHEVTYSVFKQHYMPALPQSAAVGIAVSYFFDSLRKRYEQGID